MGRQQVDSSKQLMATVITLTTTRLQTGGHHPLLLATAPVQHLAQIVFVSLANSICNLHLVRPPPSGHGQQALGNTRGCATVIRPVCK
jgi:hypothetical protein